MGTEQVHPQLLRRLTAFIQLVLHNFSRDKCFILASSVVYSTLVSAVPFIAFMISLLTAFGAFDVARQSLVELIELQFGEIIGFQVTSMINTFVINATNLGVVGLVSFLLTSVFLVNRVWVTINQIYHTSQNRNQLSRFTQFLTFLVVGTLLLSAYFGLNTLLNSFIRQYIPVTGFLAVLGFIGPWLIIFLLFSMIIFAVPNTKVRLRSALLGAAVGTVAFQLANRLFSSVVLQVVNFSIIYGSLAAILILLVWIYLWWVIIFGAVEVAYVHQYRPDEKEQKGLPNPPIEQLACGFDILQGLAAHFRKGLGAANVRDLGNRLKIPDRTLYTYLDVLERSGFIIKMDRTGHHYIPAKPLDDLNIAEIAQVLFGRRDKRDAVLSSGDRLAAEIFHTGADALEKSSLQDISSGEPEAGKSGPKGSR